MRLKGNTSPLVRFAAVASLVSGCLLFAASPASAGLVFKHPDGSAIGFVGTPRAWCGPWSGEVARPSVHVELRRGNRLWEMRGVQGDIRVGRKIGFPNSFVSADPSMAFLFVGVAGRRTVEASSAEEESGGSMAFHQLSCELGGTVEFSIHATLGSELFEGERVRVRGTYRGQVSEPPPLLPS